MYDLLSRITITCFAASYLVTLALEVSRLFFRAPIRLAVMIVFALAGLFAQTAHLFVEFQQAREAGGVPLSRWSDWCLLTSWALVVAYLVLAIRRPKSSVGLFILPVVLGLIGLGSWFFGDADYSTDTEQAILRWGLIHGIALLAGTVIVMLGFVAGVVYLMQAYRLKHKRPPRYGFRLPSLEWLQSANRKSLMYSSIFIAIGLVAGIVLNLINETVPWSEPLVVTSGILLAWLIVASLFGYFYKPARQGRKVAYLTIASFVFLGLVLGIQIFGPSATHGRPSRDDGNARMGTELVPLPATAHAENGTNSVLQSQTEAAR